MTVPARPASTWLLPGLWFLLALLALGAAAFPPSTRGMDDNGGVLSVVLHTRYQLTLVTGFAIFGAAYLLMGLVVRSAYNQWLGFTHLGLTVIGVGLIFAPSFLIMNGALNHFPDVIGAFALLNRVSTAGYLVTLVAFAVFVFVMIEAFLRSPRPSPDSR